MFECGDTSLPVGRVAVDERDVIAFVLELSRLILPSSILDVGDGDIRASLSKASCRRKSDTRCTTFPPSVGQDVPGLGIGTCDDGRSILQSRGI